MKVLKFGGSSVGTAESLQQVKSIVESRADEDLIVVVSALGGVTDQLLGAAALAEKGEASYLSVFEGIAERHRDLMGQVFGLGAGSASADTNPGKMCPSQERALGTTIDRLLSELRTRLDGVFTLKVLPEKTRGEIVSYGERMSSVIVAALIEGAQHYDALDFIRTVPQQGRNLLDTAETERRIRKSFAGFSGKVAVVPGFIARDSQSGEITNLGRGGSDYTASILAAALDAEALEIWTDVDGFMTADPRTHPDATVIPQMTYAQAQEMCDAGAKVIYPPTIAPVAMKHIPVWVKNTFNPAAPGTVIVD